MARFKLIQKPAFKAPVMIQRAGYNAEKVEFEFKNYLDRTALAAYTGWNERHDELGNVVLSKLNSSLSKSYSPESEK